MLTAQTAAVLATVGFAVIAVFQAALALAILCLVVATSTP